VWLSSHRYTLPKFEAKAGASRKALLARLNVPASRQLSPLDVEALFWRSSADRPVVVEYASDMPGSGFAPCDARSTQLPAANVGESAWNMRGVARGPASLLRFVREEVPGVTSPMLYVGMMFSCSPGMSRTTTCIASTTCITALPRRGTGCRATLRSPSRTWCASMGMAGR
jgi:hypothetical protein